MLAKLIAAAVGVKFDDAPGSSGAAGGNAVAGNDAGAILDMLTGTPAGAEKTRG